MIKTLLIFLSGVIAISCIDPQAHTKDKAKVVRVMAEQIAQKFPSSAQLSIEDYLKLKKENKKLILVDVRAEKERKVSTLPGAISTEDFEKDINKFKDHTVVAYCTIGYRSSEYVEKLTSKNIKAYNLQESLLGWAHRGYKFEVNNKPTTTAHVYEEAWNFLPKGYVGVTD